MVRVEELERLSAYAAGDLSEIERVAVERELAARAELREALAQLATFDALIAASAAAIGGDVQDDPALRAAIAAHAKTAKVAAVKPRARRVALAASLVAAVAVAALAMRLRSSSDTGVPIAVAKLQAPVMTPRLAEIQMFGSNTALVSNGAYDVGDIHFEIDGVAVISSEPNEAAARVISAQGETPMTAQLTQRFSRFAGATLALAVLDGQATVVHAGATEHVLDGWAINAAAPRKAPVPSAAPAGIRSCTPDNLPAAEMHAAMVAVDPEFDACVAKICTSDNCLGLFEVNLTLGSGGCVQALEVAAQHSVQNPLLLGCVTHALGQVHYPAPLDGKDAKLSLPFNVTKNSQSNAYELTGPASYVCIKADDAPSDARVSIDTAGSPARGPATAPITIVEFSDFECPFCVRAEDTIRSIELAYPGKVRWVFKNNPLPPHPHAALAAQAALAADAQGKFWEYAALLYTHTNALDRASLSRYATELGLDVARFDENLDRGTFAGAVARDTAEAKRLVVHGIPSFLVNGIRIQGAQPFENFAAIIDRELAH